MSHWLLRGHVTSKNETLSRQNLWAGNIAAICMTSEGNNSALLPVHCWATTAVTARFNEFPASKFPAIDGFHSDVINSEKSK